MGDFVNREEEVLVGSCSNHIGSGKESPIEHRSVS